MSNLVSIPNGQKTYTRAQYLQALNGTGARLPDGLYYWANATQYSTTDLAVPCNLGSYASAILWTQVVWFPNQ